MAWLVPTPDFVELMCDPTEHFQCASRIECSIYEQQKLRSAVNRNELTRSATHLTNDAIKFKATWTKLCRVLLPCHVTRNSDALAERAIEIDNEGRQGNPCN
jgi:hypothetical protein